MKFLKKRWHSIPVGLVSALLVLALVAGGAFAAINLSETQTITQEINPEPVYGEITAPNITLDSVVAGKSFSQTFNDAVSVTLGPDGEGKWLKMVRTYDPLYTSFDVTITLTSKPAGSELNIGDSCAAKRTPTGYGAMVLDVAGIYLFDQTIEGVAGDASGAASSTVTFTLQDTIP